MTPTEADLLLADRLLERRSRAGSVLSDEQAQEVERLLSPVAPPLPARSTSKDDLAFINEENAKDVTVPPVKPERSPPKPTDSILALVYIVPMC